MGLAAGPAARENETKGRSVSMRRSIILAAMATSAAAASPAAAQDPERAPLFGDLTLAARFREDPRMIDVRAGGELDARRVAPDCAGFVAARPAVRLTYTAANQPLILSVASGADTTLIVNGPDNHWYCNDDGGRGNNPSLRFDNPQTGRYEIWVGTRSARRPERARLHISEVTSQ